MEGGTKKMIWDNVKNIIEKNENFLITTHINSDGDGLGAELSLYYFLKNKGKKVKIINPTPVPDNLLFLFPNNEYELFDEEKHHYCRLWTWQYTISGTIF